MSPALEQAPVRGGTYALFLELTAPQQVRVGRLGELPFPASLYLYAGSAFGPGGLRARLRHHQHPPPRLHWHVDYLRRVAALTGIWATADPRRLECVWAEAARALPGARPVPGFGSSDCACPSHLSALPRAPRRRAFRSRLAALTPACAPIREIRVG